MRKETKKVQEDKNTETAGVHSDDSDTTKKKESKEIIVVATENSNYVYHMLSVAKCGYDNDYGDKYKGLYSQDDLEIIKKNASAITVAGGEHEGNLYGPIVAEAAALDDSESIVDYYQNVLENAESIAEEFGEQKETVEEMASVFIKCYEMYDKEVWPVEQEKIEAQVELYQKKFDEMDLVSKWESKLGYQAKEDFHVMFVDSLENGPEAILIADNKDIFYSGSVWCGIHPQKRAEKKVSDILGLSEKQVPLNIVFIGHPNEEQSSRDQYKEKNIHFVE